VVANSEPAQHGRGAAFSKRWATPVLCARTGDEGDETMGLLDKVKDVANKATEQAKHGIAVGKDKVEDARVRKQIEDVLQEIGDLVVGQRRGSAPADADAQIDAKVARVTELEAQLQAATPGEDEATGDTPPA
jgi:BMFP domain-containing protein YqiC